jgi:outer membrane protein OmpA-like peptidoglycan-associated protein/flagellar hook assembly protein FlgD
MKLVKIFPLSFVILLLLLAGCATVGEEEPAPTVSIALEGPAYISPAASPGVNDAFYSRVSASSGDEVVLTEFSVIVRNDQGTDIFTVTNQAPEPEGIAPEPEPVFVPAEISWNGTNNANNFVSEGQYFITARVADSAGLVAESEPVEVIVDNTPPKATVDLAYNVFSPDGDGNRDNLTIRQSVSGGDTWMARVVDRQGETVRSWEWRDGVPENVRWDGTGRGNNTLQDGTYRYILRGEDKAGNSVVARQTNIVLDTTVYDLSIAANLSAFSPNNDGTRDTLTFEPEVEEGADVVRWSFAVLNEEGEQVTQRSGEGALPDSVRFEGRAGGTPLPQGGYTGRLQVRYRNGESAEARTTPVTLDVESPSASLSLQSAQFSPNNDGEEETLTIEQQTRGGATWRARILPLEGEDPVLTANWEEPPAEFTWNGQTSSGNTAATGEYRYRLTGRDSAGNSVSVESDPFLLDRQGPSLSVELENIPFTPDGDGTNDTLRILVQASDRSSIEGWSITFYGPTGNQFDRLSGEGTPPQPVTWDGRGRETAMVESAREYTAAVTVTDATGIESTVERTVPVGILVEEDESGDLRFRITGIKFAPFEADYIDLDDPEIVERNREILDRVARILEEYPNRQVRIEGHAVHIFYRPERMEREQEETLIPLSRARAEAVRDALVERGVNGERLTVEAKGGSEPIVPFSDMDDRWKNRRVEFELIQDDGQGSS